MPFAFCPSPSLFCGPCAYLATSPPPHADNPKASSSQSNGTERNPFETMQHSYYDQAVVSMSLNSSILGTHLPGDVTPGMRTPGGITSHSAIPTTSISLGDQTSHEAATTKSKRTTSSRSTQPIHLLEQHSLPHDGRTFHRRFSLHLDNGANHADASASSATTKTRNTAAPRGHSPSRSSRAATLRQQSCCATVRRHSIRQERVHWPRAYR